MADAAYSTTSSRCEAGSGIICRNVYDAAPKGTWWNYDNCQSRQEGATSSRFGLYPITTDGILNNFPLGAPVNSLSRMQGIGTPYRYAGTTSGVLFRRAGNGQGAFTQIANGLSGNRLSMSPYRPANSSSPWQFIADDTKLVKDNGILAAVENWGINPPTQPALIAPVPADLLDIELFDEAATTSFTIAGLSGPAMIGRVQGQINTGVSTPGVQAVFTQSVSSGVGGLVRTGGVTAANVVGHGFVSGMRVSATPLNPADASFAVASAIITVVDANDFTYPNPGPNQTSTNDVAFNPIASLQPGMSITTTDANAETVYITEVLGVLEPAGAPAFVANFTKTHPSFTQFVGNYLSGTVAANTTATVTKHDILSLTFPTAQVAADENLVQMYLFASNPLAVTQVTIMFDVGDGSFTQDYYSKAVQMSPAQTVASNTGTATAAVTQAVAGRAGGAVNFSTLGGDNPSLLPADYPLLQQIQPATLNPGANVWTLVQVPLSEFVANGAAGGPNNNWENVVSWRVQVQTQATSTTVIGLDDLVFIGGSDLNSFAGQPYDYRITYINLNTGCESNPSPTMVATNAVSFNLATFIPVPLSVQQQAIEVQALASPDPQVTHWNLYRRGGSLTQAWYFVAQIPIGTLTYIDTIADATIEVNNQLLIDSDAPVTSLLPTPYAANIVLGPFGSATAGPGLVTTTFTSGTLYVGQELTVGVGSSQELAYVRAVSGTTVTLYLQLNSNINPTFPLSIPIAATTRPNMPMNLSAIAFDQAFLAGDPNNPHVLYYSRTYAPETFPSENFIEVGTPDSPIMALVVLRGFLYVFTTKTVWQIYGGSGATPVAIPTGVMHGMAASFAWAASENVVYYLSYDGVYAFTGSGSQYLTQNTEWIWTSRTETNGVIPVLNPTAKSNVIMAYGNHECFVAYQDSNNITHRQIAHDTYSRWRNDDQLVGNITAMFFEQDTGQLIVGKDDGMVYIDQINDYDSGGWGAGGEIKNAIAINLQTPQLDLGVPKAFKNFAEVTVDATLPLNLVITVTALFDSQATSMVLGTITGTGARVQYQLNVQNALGYRSLNMGLKLTGNTTAQAIFNEIHVRAVIEAEERVGYDSYLLDFGSASWKLGKQIWTVYSAPDPAGVAMSVYLDGAATPVYTFTLPQSTNRTTVKSRLPALKFRIIRFVGTSPSPFQLYTKDTECETKNLDSQKGYTKQALST